MALAAARNVPKLAEQIREFRPSLVAVYDEGAAQELQSLFPRLPILKGMEGLNEVARLEDANLVVSAISGTMGLEPTIAAIDAGKSVALANKEALVSGGSLVMSKVKEKICLFFRSIASIVHSCNAYKAMNWRRSIV